MGIEHTLMGKMAKVKSELNCNSPANSVWTGEVVVLCGVPGWSPIHETLHFYRLLSLTKTTNENCFKLLWLIRPSLRICPSFVDTFVCISLLI